MERPTVIEVRVGQRWRGSLSGRLFAVVADEGQGRFSIQYDGDASARTGCQVVGNEFIADAPGPLGGPSDTGVRAGDRVLMFEDEGGYPTGCLACGAKLSGDEAYECDACDEPGYSERRDDWLAGKRDFPRRTLITDGTPVAAAAPAKMCGVETKHGGYTFRCQMIGAHASHISGAAVEDGHKTHRWPLASKPQVREVGAGGGWINYDSMVDSDPFESYPVRRVDGVVATMAETPGVRVVGKYGEMDLRCCIVDDDTDERCPANVTSPNLIICEEHAAGDMVERDEAKRPLPAPPPSPLPVPQSRCIGAGLGIWRTR